MFRVVCYRFVTVVISEEIAMFSSIRKLSAIAGAAALLLGPTLRAAGAGDARPPGMIPKSVFVRKLLVR